MLRELYIKNIAVIDEIRLNFGSGFHIFTGETGAGKSILVEAIGLVLGEKVKSTLIRDGSSEAIVEAVFDVSKAVDVLDLLSQHGFSHPEEPGELILKRQLGQNGNNRIFVNHQRATLAILRQLSRLLIDFSGQHEQFELLDSGQDHATLDAFLPDAQLLNDYREKFAEVRALKLVCDELEKALLERDERLEWISHQLGEITGLKIESEEDEREWLKKRQFLRAEADFSGFEELSQGLIGSHDTGILSNLHRLNQAMQSKPQLKELFKDFIERLDGIRITIEDFSYDLAQKMAGVQKASGITSDEVEAQLYRLEKLKRKFGPGITDIQNRRVELESQKKSLDNIEINLKEARQKWERAFVGLKEQAQNLGAERIRMARQIETWVETELSELKMKGARFVVDVASGPADDFKTYTANGIDRVRLLLSPNPGLGLKPLAEIASGGETSRIFLALKQVLTRYRQYGTLIFDEVDSGISGAVVELTGKKLKSLAERFQVLCITHHAQIASLADMHFHVSKVVKKGNTITRVKVLSQEERIEEVARLMGGVRVTHKTREVARELLKMAQRVIK